MVYETCKEQITSKQANFSMPRNHSKQPAHEVAPTVLALGGNAIDKKGPPGTFNPVADFGNAIKNMGDPGLVVTHGNGPQIGYLDEVQGGMETSLDILGAETEGWLGYAIEQSLANQFPAECDIVTVLTRMQVDADDPAMDKPSKPIGRWCSRKEAEQLKARCGWKFIEHNGRYRRLVPSPRPLSCLQINPIRRLLQSRCIVICAGGGGIPVVKNDHNQWQGVEAVIDKDRASALIAAQLGTRLLVLATDVEGVYPTWPESGDPGAGHRNRLQEPIVSATPDHLRGLNLDSGSMGPKVEAACQFVEDTGRAAVIGHLDSLDELLQLRAGTRVLAPAGHAREVKDESD